MSDRSLDGVWGPKTAAKMDSTEGWWGWKLRYIEHGSKYWGCDTM